MNIGSDFAIRCRLDWGIEPALDPEPTAVYVHVPFCHHRCHYCNFSLIEGRRDLVPGFLDALATELAVVDRMQPVETLYLGGGTPSLLSSPEITQLCQLLRSRFLLSTEGEFTIEANPLDVTPERCEAWLQAGINRISLGGQSFQSRKLKALDRDHSPEELTEAIQLLEQQWKNISLDLIFAAPSETPEEWSNDLEQAIASGVVHLSTYGLTIEKGSRLWGERQRGALAVVPEDLELAFYQKAIERLQHAGWEHYEVSSFCKPGYRSRHNESYWLGKRWWAFGPGAARFLNQTRSINHRSTTQYMKRIARGESPVEEIDRLSHEALLRDELVFGLRRLEGIDGESFRRRATAECWEAIQEVLDDYLQHRWLEIHNGRLRLTEQGLWISDSLWPSLLV